MSNFLIIEDNEMNGDMLSQSRKRNAWHTGIALGGEEAWDMMRPRRGLLLVDTDSSIMQGYAGGSMEKSDDDLKSFPIFALT